jgi:O-antigen/teichoic acid export membrane protein
MMPLLKLPALRSLGKSEFLRNTLQLVFGTGMAQAISFAASPILTRLFSPNDFGQFTFFISIVAAFALIATLRYELAIIYAKDEKDAANVLSLSIVICTFFSFILLILVVIYRLFLSGIFPASPVFTQWLFILPFLVFILGSGSILQNWFIRKKEFRLISADKVLNSASNNFVSILLGLLHVGAWGLLVGNMTGAILFILFLLVWSFLKKQWVTDDFNRNDMNRLARKYKDLPSSNTLQAISELLQNYGVIYLTKILYSSTTLGLYALSMRILQAPLWLLGSSISQVYIKDASERFNKNQELHPLFLRTLKLSALAALPVMLLLVIGGPWIFSVFFGHSWREAGVFARILAPWMFFDFIRFTVSQTPMLLGKARAMFLISIAGNGLMIGSMMIGGLVLKDVNLGFTILSVMMSLYAITVIYWIYLISKRRKVPAMIENKVE